jgi:hypothetical protein
MERRKAGKGINRELPNSAPREASGGVLAEIRSAQRFDAAMERHKGNARVERLDALGKKRSNSLLKVGLRLPGSEGSRIEGELVAVEQRSQVR